MAAWASLLAYIRLHDLIPPGVIGLPLLHLYIKTPWGPGSTTLLMGLCDIMLDDQEAHWMLLVLGNHLVPGRGISSRLHNAQEHDLLGAVTGCEVSTTVQVLHNLPPPPTFF